MTALEDLVEAFQKSTRRVFITGAGISVASGIEPFRGTPGAVWENTVLEMGTYKMFLRDPVAQWSWYLARFKGDYTPNAAHYALAKIPCDVITQNVDNLHYEAGTPSLVEVHGSSRKVRCSLDQCTFGAPTNTLAYYSEMFDAFRANPQVDTLPRCVLCGSLLRPHVLWFDEYYQQHNDYQYDRALDQICDADLLVFVGTSFSVGFTNKAIDLAQAMHVPMWSIDPHSDSTYGGITWVQGKAEEILPLLATKVA